MGGGRLPMGSVTGIIDMLTCTRTDGRNLTDEWIKSKEAHGNSVQYVQNAAELLSVDVQNTDYLIGKRKVYLLYKIVQHLES